MQTPRGAVGILVACWLWGAGTAAAQQRPLVTEDPETVGAGFVLVEGGLEYAIDQVFPASGLKGHVLRVPVAGVSIGVSSIAEIQIDGGVFDRLVIKERFDAPLASLARIEGDRTSDVSDVVIATKVRILGEAAGRPAVAFRFAAKLPTASNESGLGLDTTDVYLTAIAGKTVESVRVVGNVGVGILQDPTAIARQNDVLTYGVSVARAVAQGTEIVGEIAGRLHTASHQAPAGTETRAVMRLGGRYTAGAGRIDAAVLLGMTSRDPAFGLTVGFTYVFAAFRVP